MDWLELSNRVIGWVLFSSSGCSLHVLVVAWSSSLVGLGASSVYFLFVDPALSVKFLSLLVLFFVDSALFTVSAFSVFLFADVLVVLSCSFI